MRETEEKLADAAREQVKKAQEEQRAAEDLYRRQWRAAEKLQSVWRMKKAVQEHGADLAALKTARIALWHKTIEDAKIRETTEYKLKALVGRAPILETDDEETKERKRKLLEKNAAMAALGSLGEVGEAYAGKAQEVLEAQAEAAKARVKEAADKALHDLNKEAEKVLDQTAEARLLWHQAAGVARGFMAEQMKGMAIIMDEEEGMGKWLMDAATKTEENAKKNAEYADSIANRVQELGLKARTEHAWEQAQVMGWTETEVADENGEPVKLYRNTKTGEATYDYPVEIQTQEEYDQMMDKIAVGMEVDKLATIKQKKDLVLVDASWFDQPAEAGADEGQYQQQDYYGGSVEQQQGWDQGAYENGAEGVGWGSANM